MGRSFCEAFACNIPVITTDVGGISEIVYNKQNGFLIKKISAKQIAQHLDILVNNTELRKQMGKWGREYMIKKLSWKIVFKNYIKKFLYENSDCSRTGSRF